LAKVNWFNCILQLEIEMVAYYLFGRDPTWHCYKIKEKYYST